MEWWEIVLFELGAVGMTLLLFWLWGGLSDGPNDG